ncbi:MAG: TPM domain-containing protein [Bacteroidales bacterium]|jgi:uncharacterized membrane protein|nr:TPM domain-containing protein [Bacteroidales bacterium]
MKASSFFTNEQQESILASVKEAENATSGEIRVHLETSCDEDVLDRAAWLFRKLGMDKTELRNGVLFYLAVNDRKFAILGDAGINAKVPHGFWDEISSLMKNHFREGRFTEGLCQGILMAGDQLKSHFPYMRDDENELADDISFDTPKKEQ